MSKSEMISRGLLAPEEGRARRRGLGDVAEDLFGTAVDMFTGDPVGTIKHGIQLGKDVYNMLAPARATTVAPGEFKQAKETVPPGTVSVPSRRSAFSTGMAGNAIASRSGLGIPMTYRNVYHPSHGPGIRLQHTQIFAMITKGVGVAALSSTIGKALSPRALAYQVSIVGDMFQNFRFEAIRLRYIPGCPTTEPMSLRIAYLPDVYTSGFDAVDYISTGFSPYQMCGAAWEPMMLTISPVPCAYPMLYQYDAAATAVADRTTKQGVICGIWSGAAAEDPARTIGTLEIDFIIDFFNPGPSVVGLPTLLKPLQDAKEAEFAHDEKKRVECLRSAITWLESQVNSPTPAVSIARLCEPEKPVDPDYAVVGRPGVVVPAVAPSAPSLRR